MTSTTGPPPAAPDDQGVRQNLSRQDEAALSDLRLQWGAAYEVACTDGEWTARSRGEADVVTAGTAAELGALICQDHSDRLAGALPRSSPAGPGDMCMGQGERALRQLRDDGVI